jgi:hypothetical protein
MEPKPSRKVPLGQSIRFAEKNQVCPTHHLDDMTDEEIYSIWYTSKEYSEIKQAYQLTIFMMESGETVTGDDHTSRGLEYRTQEGAWARYENKRDAYNAVLDEQDRQWKVDKDDYEKIRMIYLKHSTKCANAAIVRALQDERVSKELQEAAAAAKQKKKKKTVLKKKKVSSSTSTTSESGADSKKSSKSKSERRSAKTGAGGSVVLKERSSLLRSEAGKLPKQVVSS